MSVVRRIEEELQRLGEVQLEVVSLRKASLEHCRGCLQCMRRGEQSCPCRDGLLQIRDRMRAADGVIFAAPVYVHAVPALLKNFYDRLAFQCHQPAYGNQAALCVTTTELSGAEETLDYMKFVAFTWGLRLAGSLDVVAPGYRRPGAYRDKAEQRIAAAASRLWQAMTTPRPAPSLEELAFFHLMQTKVTLHREILPRDHAYWAERGWLDRCWYDDTPVPGWKRLLARFLVKVRVRRMLRRAGLTTALTGAATPPRAVSRTDVAGVLGATE